MKIKRAMVLLFIMLSMVFSSCDRVDAGMPNSPVLPVTAEGDPIEQPNLHPTQTLTVYAAASLTDVFKEIGVNFEISNPSVKVEFSFAGSQVLRTQLEQGAEADIFASADIKNIDLLISERLISREAVHFFATNRLVVILPPGNPGEIKNLLDLARPGLKVVLADNSVPAGSYARQVMKYLSQDPAYGADYPAKVQANVVSNEVDVRQVVTKVELGEADAGIVYLSDVKVASDLITILIPDQFNVIARYPIAIMENSKNPSLAEAFIKFVESPSGREILSKWGFTPGQ